MNDVQAGTRGHDARTAADVRASLSRNMNDLKRALGRLERLARSEFALGNYVAEHAVAVLLVGLVGGALLGALTAPSRYVMVATPVPRSKMNARATRRRRINRAGRFQWR